MIQEKSLKLPPELAKDPFWTKSHVRPRTTFGHSPKSIPSLTADTRYKVKDAISDWKLLDEYGTQHKRLQIESTWGKLVNSPAPGEYDPDHEKLSKRESFPSFSFTKRPADKFFQELEDKRKNPAKQIIGGLPDHFARKKATNPNNQGPSNGGDYKNINIEDMKESLLPGPGQYGGDYHKVERFTRPALPRLRPKTPVAHPRPIIDHNTFEILTMEERRRMFDGLYCITSDPTKKSVLKYSLGARRPLYGQPEDASPGPGAYTLDPVYHIGESVVLSGTESLHARKDPTATKYRKVRIVNYTPVKSFARKNLIN